MKTFTFPMLNKKRWDSRIHSANVQPSEKLIGFFLGPAGVIMLNGVIASYLNVFYTDVMRVGNIWHGMFLLVFPIFSKVIDAITNVIMGQMIDNTKSRQGKARPWLLVSLPLLILSAILLFSVPNAGTGVQVAWIVVSFNLYYSIAYTCYYMAHSMLVPLSTRNTKQRDSVALLSNMAMCIIPGVLVALLFPWFILPAIGVDQSKWLKMIVIVSIIAFPCLMMEYFFTRERITEETSGIEAEKVGPGLKEQASACFHDKYWLIIMGIILIQQIATNVQNTSLLYYCNWVLGTYNDGHTQSIVSAVGNAPLGFGILIMWPLVKKFSKRNVMLVGILVSLIGAGIFFINPRNMGIVLIGLIIRAFGALPLTYIVMAMMSDAFDHVEWQAGYRCDGFSMSVYTIIYTVTAGLAQGFFNLGLSVTGYVPPAADGSWVAQSETVQGFFTFGYQGLYALISIVMFVLFWFYDVEKQLPKIHEDINERHRKEAEAKGIEWVAPEELARREQEEEDKAAEENRIRELRERCEKRGLNFDDEEAKYQAKLAEQKAKADAKAAAQKAKAEERAARKRK